jgi:hypothetical protein
MSLEENSIKIKKKKKQVKKTLPKNVFEIVGESGQIVERVDSNKKEKNIEKSKEKIEEKPTFSERTKKRRVNNLFYFIIFFFGVLRDVNGIQ